MEKVTSFVKEYIWKLSILNVRKDHIQTMCYETISKLFPFFREDSITIEETPFLNPLEIPFWFRLKEFGISSEEEKILIKIPYKLFETPEKLKDFILDKINKRD